MAINKNHLFEELDGVKCAIVETVVAKERVEFLKTLLSYNGYTVVVVPSPPAKVAAAPVAAVEGTENPVAEKIPEPIPLAETFTIGVTHLAFNATNAIFGRLLKTPTGHVVTQLYWLQKERESHDEIPYYEKKI